MKIRGFSLVELLVTITIMAIVTTMAVPSVISQLKKMESERTAQQLQSFFSEGRQDALIYQQLITLCLANASNQCVNDGTYLLRFIDKDDNHIFDASRDTLRYRTPLNLRYGRLHSSLGVNRTYIKLQANTGRAVGYLGHISYCPTDGERQLTFKVTLSMTVITRQKADRDTVQECQGA